MSKWDKYFKKNSDQYADCQLIAAMNAYVFHHGKPFCSTDSPAYHKMIQACGCRAGSCINIKPALRSMALKQRKVWKHFSPSIDVFKLPLVLSVWETHYGFHSILAVDYIKRCTAFRVLNFAKCKQVTKDGWIFEEDLYHYMNPSNCAEPAAVQIEAR